MRFIKSEWLLSV